MRPNTTLSLLAILVIAMCSHRAAGQELEARAYAPNPIGARFLVMSFSHSDGDVLLDASSPIQDFAISAGSLTSGFGGTFAIADRVASVAIAAPYVDATATGLLNGVPERRDRVGFGDLRLRVTLSLLPGSARDLADFKRAPPSFVEPI